MGPIKIEVPRSLLVTALLLASCAGMKASRDNTPAETPAELGFEATAPAKPAQPAPANWLVFRKNLPGGFEQVIEKNPNGTNKGLLPPTAKPGFPTPDDENAVLGRLTWRYPDTRKEPSGPDKERLRALAAEHGANVAYMDEDRHVWALYVSAAKPAPAASAADVLAKLLPAGGRVIEKKTFDLAAAKPGSFTTPVRKGKCYSMAVALDSGAQRNPTMGWGASWNSQVATATGAFAPTTAGTALFDRKFDGISSRGTLVSLGCPLFAGDTTFDVQARPGEVHGSGPVLVALVETPQPDGDALRRGCQACSVANFSCPNLTLGACQPAVNCLKALKLRPADCSK